MVPLLTPLFFGWTISLIGWLSSELTNWIFYFYEVPLAVLSFYVLTTHYVHTGKVSIINLTLQILVSSICYVIKIILLVLHITDEFLWRQKHGVGKNICSQEKGCVPMSSVIWKLLSLWEKNFFLQTKYNKNFVRVDGHFPAILLKILYAKLFGHSGILI